MRVRKSICLLAAMILCLSMPVIASTIQQGTPTPKSLITQELFPAGSQAKIGNCSCVNVRKGPGVGYGAFTYLSNGDVITVLDYRQKWVKIDTPKGQGWVYAGYVLNDAVVAATASGGGGASSSGGSSVGRPTPVGSITADMFPIGSQAMVDFCYFLNVRGGPDKSYGAFTSVAKGDVITVLDYSQKWVKIDTAKGQGWIYGGYLSNGAGAVNSSTNALVENQGHNEPVSTEVTTDKSIQNRPDFSGSSVDRAALSAIADADRLYEQALSFDNPIMTGIYLDRAAELYNWATIYLETQDQTDTPEYAYCITMISLCRN